MSKLNRVMPSRLLQAMLFAGLIVGALDITFACLNAYFTTGTTPGQICRFIASGVFGKEAFSDGLRMALAGLLFHFTIAMSFTAIFFLIYPRIKAAAYNKVITGILYGIMIWIVMNLLVLPLSNVPPIPFSFRRMLIAMFILVIAIGLPLVYFANRFYRQK